MSERVNEENYQKLCEFCALCGDEVSTVNTVRKIRLFMQNEPNFNLGKIDLSYYVTSTYKDFVHFAASKNEPKRTQFASQRLEYMGRRVDEYMSKK